jgi:hypothetical protein
MNQPTTQPLRLSLSPLAPLFCLALIVGLLAPQAHGQHALSANDTQLLARLDAAAWPVREAALVELESGTWEPARLRALYHATDSPEAQDRVLTAAKHLYFKSLWSGRVFTGESAAMGFTFPPKPVLVQPVGAEMPVSALFVSAPLCGMPSVLKLRPGDRVLKIDEADFSSIPQDASLSDLLRRRLSRCKPGESLPLVIERDGQQMEVQLVLAPREAMVDMFLSGGFGVRTDIMTRWLEERDKIVLP